MHLVLEGGGVRSAFSAGVLDRIHASGRPVTSVIGASTGAINAAYFCAGQLDELLYMWREFVAGTGVINYVHLLPTGRAACDFDYLVDEVMTDIVPLDAEAACAGSPHLYLTATDIEREATVVKHPAPETVHSWIKASAAFPVGYNKVIELDGLRLMDGGMVRSVPWELELGGPVGEPTVVLLTRRADVTKGPANWWQRVFIRFWVPAHARDLTRFQHVRHNELMGRLKASRDSGEIVLVEPPEGMPVQRLTRNRAVIEEGIRIGREVGDALLRRLDG